MKMADKINEGLKHVIRTWLNIAPAAPREITLKETMDFEENAILNKIWYEGDGNVLAQYYESVIPERKADIYKFWAGKCTPGMELRKMHTGIPGLTVRILTDIVIADMNDFEFAGCEKYEETWKETAEENELTELLKKSVKDMLVVGDGAFKVTIDTEISEYPILEWYPGDQVEYVRKRGRIREVIFKTDMGKGYMLHEHYGYGYITNELYFKNLKVDMGKLEETKEIRDTAFDKTVILAVPAMVFDSSQYKGRGRSIFCGKLDSYDALDEAWSQWMDALRAGRAKTYVPDCLIPKDPATGMALQPNPFDCRYFAADNDMSEKAENKIQTDQPAIPHESYLATYCTALDLSLQGIISPSTLGIDVKKLDNADAQREKEKATLYTRNAIVEALQKILPKLVEATLNAYNILHKKAPEKIKINAPFGEYANPSFESQVETVGKARTQGIMSIERCVEELYGDTLDEHCKQEEIARLKAEQGIVEMEEPEINLTAGEFKVSSLEGGAADAGQSGKQNVSDEQGGISGASPDSKGTGANRNLRPGEK